MTTFFLILGVVLMSAAIVLLFLDIEPAAIWAFFGMWLLFKSGYAPVGSGQMMFWAIVTLIMVLLYSARRSPKGSKHPGHLYRVVGSLAGMACGLAFGYAGVIIGALLGALLGGVAFALTPAGGKRFSTAAMRATVADGYPAAVLFSMVGITLAAIINGSQGL